MADKRISLNDCLWVYGEKISTSLANARTEIGAVRQRGLAQFILKNYQDPAELEQLRKRVWKTDAHVILTRLHPAEMAALKPIFLKRKNFSVMYDDWWIMPHWFTREAEHVIFRKYNGVAVRMGTAAWTHYTPPLMYNPFNPDAKSNYAIAASALRLPMLAISPFVNLANIYRRHTETIAARRFLYFPFAVSAADLPLVSEPKYQHDFTNIWSVCGIFMMRDPFVPFHHTFANLYADRLKMSKLLVTTDHSFYHTRQYVYKEYVETVQQSRYTVASGGLCDKFNPNFLECACLGTPMIGRSVPLEAPWFDDCLFPVDIMNLTPATIKPVLEEALAKQPALRANCLNWRDRLLKMYDPHTLMDMLQAQIDGQPIPPGYLKPNSNSAPPNSIPAKIGR
jgi:hypothetical protein